MYGEIVIRLKAIKYKLDIACYLSFLPSGLAIEHSHKAYRFISIISKLFCHRVFCYLSNKTSLGFWFLP